MPKSRPTRRPEFRRTLFTALFPSLLLVTVSSAGVAGEDGFQYSKGDSTPLANGRTFELQGNPIPGGCSYIPPNGRAEIPPEGWEIRAIAVNMKRCVKIYEEGNPIGPAADRSSAAASAAVTTKSAWQKLWYTDVVGFTLTYDVTEVTWSYNGTCNTGGRTRGIFHWWGDGGGSWRKQSATLLIRQNLCSIFEGESVSTFFNDGFCAPLPRVWTYYYHNRVSGNPSGTSFVGWNFDSTNECVPIFDHRNTAYGTFPEGIPADNTQILFKP